MNYGENEISQALIKLGHSVTIVTGDKYFPFPNYEDTVGKLLGSREQKVGKRKEKGVTVIREKIIIEFAARAFFGGVKERISQVKPDLILVSGTSTPVAVQAALFKPNNTRLILIDSHLPSELRSGNTLFKDIFYFTFRTFFASLISKRADKIIAVQEGTVQVIKQAYGIEKIPVIISHGTDMELFKFNKNERKNMRKKLGLKELDFVIITTGKIIPAKGVELLFQACQTLFKKHSTIHLLVIGDGPDEYKQKCLRFIPESKKKHVHLEGIQRQNTLPAYYSAADVAVWPLQESLAMNDAISCGLPIIANDKIGVKERFSNKNAFLYEQGNVTDLVKKIEYVFLHPTEGKKMGERGRKLVEQKMSWSQKAKEYIQ